MLPYWSIIPSVTAVVCGAVVFAAGKHNLRFLRFMGYTLIFDGLFIILQSLVSDKMTDFSAVTYLLYTVMMLSVPFFYYFATRFLLKEEGVERKDFWMLEILLVYAVVLVFIMTVIPASDKKLFHDILNNGNDLDDLVPTGTAVMLAMDNAAFLFFVAEQLFIQIFCMVNLIRYRNKLASYYSSNNGKFLGLMGVLFFLVIIRLVIYLLINFLPVYTSTTGFHIVQTVFFCLFFICMAIFTCSISYTAENLGHQLAAEASKNHSSGTTELIRSRINKLIEDNFFLDPDVDLIGISSDIHINCKYLAEYIKSEYGETFMVMVNRLRIEYSKKVLKEEYKLSLEDVALKSGFTSLSTFIRNFIKNTGITPSKFRKNEAFSDN